MHSNFVCKVTVSFSNIKTSNIQNPMKISCFYNFVCKNHFIQEKWQFLNFRGCAHIMISLWSHTFMDDTYFSINGEKTSTAIYTGSNFRVIWSSMLIIWRGVSTTPLENMFRKNTPENVQVHPQAPAIALLVSVIKFIKLSWFLYILNMFCTLISDFIPIPNTQTKY